MYGVINQVTNSNFPVQPWESKKTEFYGIKVINVHLNSLCTSTVLPLECNYVLLPSHCRLHPPINRICPSLSITIRSSPITRTPVQHIPGIFTFNFTF